MKLQQSWVEELVEEGKKNAGGYEQLAEIIGIKRQSLMGWTTGSSPRLFNFIKLLDFLGGDIARALPEYSHNEEAAKLKSENEHLTAENATLRQRLYQVHASALGMDPQQLQRLVNAGRAVQRLPLNETEALATVISAITTPKLPSQ